MAARNWTALYQRERGGVLIPAGLAGAPAGCDQAKPDIDQVLDKAGVKATVSNGSDNTYFLGLL